MTKASFTAEVNGTEIHCSMTLPSALSAPVFCFSLMAPPAVVSGGTLIRTDGGYGEVQLPDLAAGNPHSVVLRYADSEHVPVNRAWLPLGAYLRSGHDIISLPKLFCGVRAAQTASAPDIRALGLIPKPKSWKPSGKTLSIQNTAMVKGIWQNVEALAQRCNLPPLQRVDGVPITAVPSQAMAPSAYQLLISENGIEIQYGDAAGAHYAGISLLVLRHIHNGEIPCGTIDDQPRFDWRGQHLDCARHFYEIDSITKLIDLMSLLKMNRFHWHFSDDEAFRLELQSVPELAKKTGLRGEQQLVPGVFGGGPEAGGTYSREDAQTVIAHAKALFIEVLPEIEFPAHALGFVRTFPETRDSHDQGTEVSVQGYAENVLNPALPRTWEIVEAIAHEIGEIFPLGTVHLGADELPTGTWDGSPAVEQLKADEGLETSDDVQEWALNRLAGTLLQTGIRSAAWEEAARGKNGGIGNGALLFSWTGQEAGIDAAKAGYDIVMSPAQHVYLDMAHTSDPDDWGAAWAAFVSLEDTINWTVVPDPAIATRVIGVEGTFWSEFTTEDQQIEPMIAPRILGIATKGWVAEDTISPVEFTNNARAFCDLLTQMGWQWNRSCFKVDY